MPVHRMSDARYTDLLRLVLQEAHGIYVADRLSDDYTLSQVSWLREWSMLIGYVELTAITFDPAAPSGFKLPSPHLTGLGHAKLAELDHLYSMLAPPVKPLSHLIWFPRTDKSRN